MMLNEKNFFEFAVKSYRNPRCYSINEFMEDFARIKYVKRLLNRYTNKGNLQERLIVNHLVSIYNVFDIACANEILFFRCDKSSHPALRAFLQFLNYLPEDSKGRIDAKVTKKLASL